MITASPEISSPDWEPTVPGSEKPNPNRKVRFPSFPAPWQGLPTTQGGFHTLARSCVGMKIQRLFHQLPIHDCLHPWRLSSQLARISHTPLG